MQTVFFRIDPKTLQLKWTDIEIRKHVIPQMQSEQKKEAEVTNESLEDDWPPLEQVDPETTIKTDDSKAPSPDRSESHQVTEA